MTRKDCVDYLRSHGLPVPPKSACICCPYRSPSEWLAMKREAPEEFAEAVEFDELNRHNPLAVRYGGCSTADEIFIYRGPRGPEPLATANLEEAAARERRGRQLPLFIECAFCGH